MAKWKIFLLLAAVICAASLVFLTTSPNKKINQDVEIREARFPGLTLYIPEQYLQYSHTSVGRKSALIVSWLPGAGIPPGQTPMRLLQAGEWYKNILILIAYTDVKPKSIEELGLVKTLRATKVVGTEYGLLHKTQDKDGISDDQDLWLEQKDGETISYIVCSEKLTVRDTPLCTQYIRMNRLWIEASYDRRLLPQWKNIKDGVEDMITSFLNPKTAESFVRTQM